MSRHREFGCVSARVLVKDLKISGKGEKHGFCLPGLGSIIRPKVFDVFFAHVSVETSG